MSKVIFSGIQPSGELHLGNYLGAIKQWIGLQSEAEQSIFCIVDLHAITVAQDPKALKRSILSVAAWYLASGIEPDKSAIFVQSDRPEHSELAWILNTITNMGELERMTQFKDKTSKLIQGGIPVGLFDYPVLMAADILLYKTTHVPVGEDQKQHIELTRDLAERFNSRYKDTFVVPEPIIKSESARIMGLDDPIKKMSKSASINNYISLIDRPEEIRQKIRKAVTDSGGEIRSGEDKPAMTNLLNIFSEVTDRTITELESQFAGKGYSQFKEALADAIIEFLKPLQVKYQQYLSNEEVLRKILSEGAERVRPTAEETIKTVKAKIGLGV